VLSFLTLPPDNLDKVLLWLLIGLTVAVGMEIWAAILHRHLWHGPLWFLHRSHHEEREGHFERNDLFAVFHAGFAIALILYGCVGPVGWLREAGFGFGLGMTAFGLSYMLVHDGLVHERLPVGFLERLPWVHRLAAAHRAHHRTGRFPYGMFLGPQEARRASRRSRAARQ
jgi:beta-carotene 3-hydroxylase